jgi:hypothetical protein
MDICEFKHDHVRQKQEETILKENVAQIIIHTAVQGHHFGSVYPVFENFGFWKSEERIFKKNNRNRTRID